MPAHLSTDWGLSHSSQTVSAASPSSIWPPGWQEEALKQPLPASSQLFCFGTESEPRKWLNKQEGPHLAQRGHSLHFVAFEWGLWMSHSPIILEKMANKHNWREQRLFHNFRGFPSIADPKTWRSGSIRGSRMWETVHITAGQEAERVAETLKGSPHNDSLQLHLLKAPQAPKIALPFGDTNSKHAPVGGILGLNCNWLFLYCPISVPPNLQRSWQLIFLRGPEISPHVLILKESIPG